MSSCKEKLLEYLPSLFGQESPPIMALIAETLDTLARGHSVSMRTLQSTSAGWDALLLMDEWRLVYPVGGSLTKAWEDTSQLLTSHKDLRLALPPWIEHLILVICHTGRFVISEILQSFFTREKDPSASGISSFLIEMTRRASSRGVLDAGDINRMLREIPIGIPADTLIARLKNYGFISPHLRADFFRMHTPQYEIHPVLVRTARLADQPGKTQTP